MRQELLEFMKALGCKEIALRRDECGDWRIGGDFGHIYAVPGVTVHGLPPGEGFQIFVMGCETVRQWSAAKSAMKPFTEITNDGDMEGAFFLRRLPTPEEAAIIRSYVGLRKRREDSEETIAAVQARTSKSRFQTKRLGLDASEVG